MVLLGDVAPDSGSLREVEREAFMVLPEEEGGGGFGSKKNQAQHSI